jgi:hypothetical protein
MRILIAPAFFLLLLSVVLADPQTDAAQRAMGGLRTQWQLLADTGAILVARCERGGFHGRRLGPDARVDVDIVVRPGERVVGIVRVNAAIDSNGSSPRANAVEVPGTEPHRFVCFNSPDEARQAADASDFTMGNPRRPILIRRQNFEGFYHVEDGALVLVGGNPEMRERILKTFEPDLQRADSPWRKVMRFEMGR